MKYTTELSVSELKAILELIQELCRKAGIDEALSRSLFHKLNERHLK